jgi:Predicted membrane protein (DUF2142)
MRGARAVRLTFVVGIAILLAAVALTLCKAPPRVVRVGASTSAIFDLTAGDLEACQTGEVLPAGVSAIRLSLVAGGYGARVHVRVYGGSQVLAEGRRSAGWIGNSVTVPVSPLRHVHRLVKLCFAIGPNSEPILLAGSSASQGDMTRSRAGEPLGVGGKLGVEYLAPGHGSWWSRALLTARHMGIGHALSGSWVTLLIAALMAGVGLLAIWLPLREWPSRLATVRQGVESSGERNTLGRPSTGVRASLRRVPSAAWVCALVAFLSATAWSLIVPPFQGRDEVDHFAYVEQLAENQTLPENGHEIGERSPEETLVLQGLHYAKVVFSPQTLAISSMAEQQTLTEDVHAGASLQGSGEAGVATSEPPLYYLLQTIPYALAQGNILNQLQLMRLVGAVFGAITALLAFLFLREILPSEPWAATMGALCIALQPLFAFVSGSVNPDSMLLAVTAGIFLCLARAFRRGLTRRLAVALGILIAVGFLTKLNFIGVAFGVFVGLAVLGVRRVKSGGPHGLLLPMITGCIGISPAIFYVLRNLLAGHPAFGILSGESSVLETISVFHEFSYIWQTYLPRLPGMPHYFKGVTVYKDVWFDRSIGLYGWMDTVFPGWVDDVALVPAAAIALLCGRELVAHRKGLRARLPELGVYAAIAIGILVMIGAASYSSDAVLHKITFGEPRYLLPLLPLLGGVICLAVRGAGRRWAPVAGATVVVLFLAHDIFSQLQVIARYYG